MHTPPDNTWAILKSLPDRQEYVPRDYEFLPDALKRDVEPHGPRARDQVCRALAEGDVEPILKTHLGHRERIPLRVWDKYPLARKVYPRFLDGKMRIGRYPHSGPYIVGWVFVPKAALGEILQRTPDAPITKTRTCRFSQAELDQWYGVRVEEFEATGRIPSRADDWKAAGEVFKDIPRSKVRDVRNRLAPNPWHKRGRRPKKIGQN